MVGHLHDEEREELVLLVHLPCGHWVTVVVVGVHHLQDESNRDIKIDQLFNHKNCLLNSSYEMHKIL